MNTKDTPTTRDLKIKFIKPGVVIAPGMDETYDWQSAFEAIEKALIASKQDRTRPTRDKKKGPKPLP